MTLFFFAERDCACYLSSIVLKKFENAHVGYVLGICNLYSDLPIGEKPAEKGKAFCFREWLLPYRKACGKGNFPQLFISEYDVFIWSCFQFAAMLSIPVYIPGVPLSFLCI